MLTTKEGYGTHVETWLNTATYLLLKKQHILLEDPTNLEELNVVYDKLKEAWSNLSIAIEEF